MSSADVHAPADNDFLGRVASIGNRALDVARASDFAGYSKHDGLNARWLETVAGTSRIPRLVGIQAIMRTPVHVRPWLGVAPARNAKGIALFARALLARYRLFAEDRCAAEARALLEWLHENPSPGWQWPCWGYPYPWQDVGFFAPRDYPNRIVTTNVVQAFVEAYETLRDDRYLEYARGGVEFLLEAPRTLHEDERHWCLSYVPSEDVSWIVMDVSALVGAAVSRYAALAGRTDLIAAAERLVRYVVSKQTDYGAWFYTEPPGDSHITHDNYHTGLILDAILRYQRVSGNREFSAAYERGLDYYREHLFEADGAPRFMNDKQYPYDIHSCAQGVLTFSLAHQATGRGKDMATRVLRWTIDNMYDPETGWFHYQRRRFFVNRVRLLRWCQAWMAHAIGVYLETCGGQHD